MLASDELKLQWHIHGKLDGQAVSSKAVVVNGESCFKRSALYSL